MKLEHKHQRVLSLNEFTIRMGKYRLLALGLIIISVTIGVAGYRGLVTCCGSTALIWRL